MKRIAILLLVEIVLCFSMSGCYEKQDIIDARDEGYHLAEEKYTEELETLKSDANSYERRISELEKELHGETPETVSLWTEISLMDEAR